VGDNGQIWGTNTGYSLNNGNDVHGDVTYFKDQIVRLMELWDGPNLEVGINHGGGDYRDFAQATSDPNECRDACIADITCRAFTSVAPGFQGPQAHCWLKNRVTDWTYNAACTSGTIFDEEFNIDRPGQDYSNFGLSDSRPELCHAACARDSNCQAYTYVQSYALPRAPWCWLKNGIPAVSSNSATVSGARRGFEDNVDRGGWDYTNFNVADRTACRDRCASDAICKAFSYVYSSEVCRLKKAAPAPYSATGVTSGMKRGLEVNTDRRGQDYRDFSQSTDVPEVCQAACAADSACQSWTFVPAGDQTTASHCWLKNAVPVATTVEGLVSGIKGAEFF
jgi:hypothetical protein